MRPYDKTLTRLVITLTKLSNDDRPTMKDLSEEFNVGIRTIQRDIYERLMYFPIEKDTVGQLKFIDGFTLDKSTLENDEMLLLYLSMSQVKSMSPTYEKKIETIFSKLLTPSYSTPYSIKSQGIENLDFDSRLSNTLEDVIEKKIIIELELINLKALVQPLKIINLQGLWYLLAKDTDDGLVKSYLLASIKKLKQTKESFVEDENIEQVLDSVHSSWFKDGNSFQVKILVDRKIAHFFKLRKVIHTQKLEEEKEDGSLIVSFDVSHEEDVDNIIKAWLPDIKILEPVKFKNKLEKELSLYLNQIREKKN